MVWKKILLLLLFSVCLPGQGPPGLAAETEAVEEYSRAGGNGPFRVRIAPALPYQPPSIPKTLDSLRSVAGDQYRCMQRDNYLITSDLSPAEYDYLVDGVLDYCSKALIRVFFDKGPVRDKTVNIFVFRDYERYEDGLRRFIGMEPISPYGHYGHSQKYLVINYETGPGTMVHELTHALMSEDFPEAPIWLAEGLASLYEHCRAEGDVLRGDDNWRLPELQAALRSGTLTPLSVLFAMQPNVFRGARESLNYAQARYFCKYLEELGILPDVYKDFRDHFNLDPSGARFVIKAFELPLERIEASWRRWITFQYWKE